MSTAFFIIKNNSKNMRFRTWNVRSMYRAGSIRVVAEELSKYKSDLVGVQKVRWDGSGTERAGEYTFFYGKGNENHELGTGFFIHKGIYQQLRRQSLLLIGCHT
jgi:exonuclease III